MAPVVRRKLRIVDCRKIIFERLSTILGSGGFESLTNSSSYSFSNYESEYGLPPVLGFQQFEATYPLGAGTAFVLHTFAIWSYFASDSINVPKNNC